MLFKSWCSFFSLSLSKDAQALGYIGMDPTVCTNNFSGSKCKIDETMVAMKHQKHWWWMMLLASARPLICHESPPNSVVSNNSMYLLKMLWLQFWADLASNGWSTKASFKCLRPQCTRLGQLGFLGSSHIVSHSLGGQLACLHMVVDVYWAQISNHTSWTMHRGSGPLLLEYQWSSESRQLSGFLSHSLHMQQTQLGCLQFLPSPSHCGSSPSGQELIDP